MVKKGKNKYFLYFEMYSYRGSMEEEKRLFFGAEVSAPWPKELPQGRVLEEKARHLTLAFLGETRLFFVKTTI